MTTKLIKLNDISITDKETISFIFQCLNLMGLHFVEDSIAKHNRELYEYGKKMESIYRSAEDMKEVSFETDKETFAELCSAIVDVLIEYEDLDNIIGVNSHDADKFLKNIHQFST